MLTDQENPYPFIPLSEIEAVDATLADHLGDWIETGRTETETVHRGHDDLELVEAIDRAVDPMDWYATVGIDTILQSTPPVFGDVQYLPCGAVGVGVGVFVDVTAGVSGVEAFGLGALAGVFSTGVQVVDFPIFSGGFDAF